MAGISQALRLLSEEASHLRDACGERRMRWPKEFRQKVLTLWSGGVSRKEIVEATGVSPFSLYDWRRRESRGEASDFTELQLVSNRKHASLLLIRTRHGSEIAGLPVSDLRWLLKEGLL